MCECLQISEAVQTMLELIHVHNTDLGVSAEDQAEDPSTSHSFDAVLAAVLDPILEAVDASAQVRRRKTHAYSGCLALLCRCALAHC